MLLLPLPASPAYNVITTIDGVDYELVYTYDEHRNLWRFGVDSLSGDPVMGHRPLLPFVQMRPNAFGSTLDGVFALIAPLPTGDAYEALVGGLWSVVYGLPAEVAELADGLADLAGDAEDPVVPIEVLYPPNNAVLSNPVVTFNGTGPANQLVFARGESIQVDGMGGWVWAHTFSEASPNVVFEGESGQRATVRLSIIMQPLLINPVGQDIDGTRYAFTEDVEVTGAATPDSTITVNGQPVSVGGDGLWSVELTLQAGQSHVITAQGGDGQVVQASVYVWGEQDALALEPDVWLDPRDASTLFIDSAGTTPVQFSGDPIGLWRNKGGLGSAGDAVQAVSASRPVWTDAGGGVITLESGQTITTGHVAEMPFSAAVGWTRSPSMTGAGHMLTSGGGNVPRWNINSQAKGVQALGPQGRITAVADLDGSAYAAWSTGSLKIRTLENQDENATTVEPFTPQPTRIGHLYAGDVGHVFVFDRELTYEEQMKLLAWMESQHD